MLFAAGLPVNAATSMGGQATVGRIVDAAGGGSAATRAALRRAGRALGVAVAGTVNLDEASREVALDFLALFSSAAAVMGNSGQAVR